MKSLLSFVMVNGIWILITFAACCLSVIFAERLKKIPIIGKVLDVLERWIG